MESLSLFTTFSVSSGQVKNSKEQQSKKEFKGNFKCLIIVKNTKRGHDFFKCSSVKKVVILL